MGNGFIRVEFSNYTARFQIELRVLLVYISSTKMSQIIQSDRKYQRFKVISDLIIQISAGGCTIQLIFYSLSVNKFPRVINYFIAESKVFYISVPMEICNHKISPKLIFKNLLHVDREQFVAACGDAREEYCCRQQSTKDKGIRLLPELQ